MLKYYVMLVEANESKLPVEAMKRFQSYGLLRLGE